eukprot:Awhi_evm1s1755
MDTSKTEFITQENGYDCSLAFFQLNRYYASIGIIDAEIDLHRPERILDTESVLKLENVSAYLKKLTDLGLEDNSIFTKAQLIRTAYENLYLQSVADSIIEPNIKVSMFLDALGKLSQPYKKKGRSHCRLKNTESAMRERGEFLEESDLKHGYNMALQRAYNILQWYIRLVRLQVMKIHNITFHENDCADGYLVLNANSGLQIYSGLITNCITKFFSSIDASFHVTSNSFRHAICSILV